MPGVYGGISSTTDYSPPTTHYPLSFHILAHSFALFCTRAKINPFLFNRFRTLCAKHPGWGGVLLTSCPSSHRTASAQTCSVCLRVKLSDSVNSALSAPSALIPVLYPGQSLGVEGSRLHLGRTSVLTSLLPYVLTSLHPYFVTSLLPLPSGNSIGSAGGVSAIASSCGYCRRSGSGTFTFDPVRLLMSCSALTTDLP